MLDDMLDYLENIRERPVWQPIPDAVRERFRSELPSAPSDLAAVHGEFLRDILPYATGNMHPGFMGWVHGGGTPVGMLAEMLAAGLNANLGGRDHIPIEVERQIVRWMRSIFGFPESATGLFVTGTSMANLIGVLIARDVALGFEVRCAGVAAASEAADRLRLRRRARLHRARHGFLRHRQRRAASDSRSIAAIASIWPRCENAIEADRSAGFTPFLLVGTAGTVDTGAIDDLDALADLARREHLWFHVDGAYGALAMLAPDLAPRLDGIERADSLAFDFHKWGQVPYDAGFILVRDGVLHRKAFATSAAYLRREARGLAGGSPWPCDFGPDLSRGFRALKTWFTLKVYGADALGATISRTCELARYLESRVAGNARTGTAGAGGAEHRLFPLSRRRDAIASTPGSSVELQEAGDVAPSTTIVDGRLAIRAAIVNHRTSRAEIDTLVEKIVALGRAMRDRAARSSRSRRRRSCDGLAAAHGSRKPLCANWKRASQPIRRRRSAVRTRLSAGRNRPHRGGPRRLSRRAHARSPSHRAALNNLGTLLHDTGYRTAARTAYAEAVGAASRRPDEPRQSGQCCS